MTAANKRMKRNARERKGEREKGRIKEVLSTAKNAWKL
jgi:hypothetical protein